MLFRSGGGDEHVAILAPDVVLRLVGEVDRTYVGTRGHCTIDDPALGRTLTVRTTGAPTTAPVSEAGSTA